MPPDTPPHHPWRWLCIPVGVLLPLLCALNVWWSGDLFLTPLNCETLHHTILQHAALRQNMQPIWWDLSILGGYPGYAAAQGGVWYPGHLLFWLLPNPLAAWNWTLLLHLSVAGGLLALRCHRAQCSLPLTLGLLGVFVGSMDAFWMLHYPALVLLLPWLIGTELAESTHERPPVFRIAQAALLIGIAASLGWLALKIASLVLLGYALGTRRFLLLWGLALGLLIGAIQWIPLAFHRDLIDLSTLLPGLLALFHPVALLPVLALGLRDSGRPPWWLVLLVPIVAFYPWTPAIGVFILLACATLIPMSRLPLLRPVLNTIVPLVLVVSGFAGVATVSVPYAALRQLVNDTRGLFPRASHPSTWIMQTPRDAGRPAATYGRPASLSSLITRTPAWPLLWNLAPDPDLGAATVALPWSTAWRTQLATIDTLLQHPAKTQVGELILAEYTLQALGVTVLAGLHPNYPFLDYAALDPEHPAQMTPAATSEEDTHAALEDALIDTLAHPDDLPPPPPLPAPFDQQPVRGRYFYRNRLHLPYAILLYRPDTALSLSPGNWPALTQAALEKLQADTNYPYQTIEERERYVLLADDTPSQIPTAPVTLLVDRGYALETTPRLVADNDGVTLTLAAPVDAAPWLLLRTALVPGWSAQVNGEPVTLARADGPWMAIPLESEQANQIALRYTVPGLAWGRGLSVIGLVLLSGLVIVGVAQSGALYSPSDPTPAGESHTPASPASAPSHPPP